MHIYKIILLLALLSLLVFLPQRAIAEPIEIEVRSPNIKVYAFEKVLDRWGEDQWSYFNDLIERESHWNSEAQNPNSTAYGLAQFLNSTWKSVDCEKTSDKYKQIDCALDYVANRYTTPQGAIKFWNKNKWY